MTLWDRTGRPAVKTAWTRRNMMVAFVYGMGEVDLNNMEQVTR